MRTLEKHAYIMGFVVAYKCSECGMIFQVPIHKHITGGGSGTPKHVQDEFEHHVCSATGDPMKPGGTTE